MTRTRGTQGSCSRIWDSRPSPNDVREGFAVVDRVNEALQAETDPLIPVLTELWSMPDQDTESTGDPQPEPEKQP
ncbi:MAG: hypothetical protein ACFHWZ_04665 [Phycisphaerales bacterium]